MRNQLFEQLKKMKLKNSVNMLLALKYYIIQLLYQTKFLLAKKEILNI